MLVTTKGRYALRVMVDLAERGDNTLVPLQGIADRQKISEKYLEGILPVLVRAGLLDGIRGKGGGYRLTRKPEEYTIGSILKLTERTLAVVSCLDKEARPCDKDENCKTLPMWKELDALVDNFFETTTLADLLKN